MSGQTVQKSLYIGSEDGVKSCVVDFIQMFSKTVPEVKGNLHDLSQTKTDTRIETGIIIRRQRELWLFLYLKCTVVPGPKTR